MAVQAPAQVDPTPKGLMIADPGESAASKLEKVLITGDLAALTPDQRVWYYHEVCESAGLNPLTKPFDYLNLNGKLVLYANRSCTDQVRRVNGIEVTKLERDRADDLAIVTAYGRDRTGRQDSAIGAVSIANLKGEALANALMKAETKAKRRLTLSMSGLGLLDEIEVESLPGAWREEVDAATGEIKPVAPAALADRLAAQAAALEAASDEADAAGTGATAARPAQAAGEAAGASSAATNPEADVIEGTAIDVTPEAAPKPALSQCDSVSPYGTTDERCGKAKGHTGNHANKAKETW